MSAMEIAGFYLPGWLLVVVLFVATIYLYLTWRFGELTALGIPHPKPVLPLVGNMRQLMSEKPGFRQYDEHMLRKYGKIFGMYEGRDPVIIVADVDILKNVLVKDFHNFTNRRRLYLRGLLKQGLLDSEEPHWRRIRNTVTQAFSSGKIKQMVKLINQCGRVFESRLRDLCETDAIFEVKQVVSAFTMDTIASTAFGVQLDSQQDENNQFIHHGKTFFELSLKKPIVMVTIFLRFLCPLLEKFDIAVWDSAAIRFFRKLINDTLQQRDHDQQFHDRVDFLKVLLNARRSQTENGTTGDTRHTANQNVADDKGLSDEEIVAQCLLFLLAGFDTTASSMSMLIYNLAVHPEVQDKVYRELQQTIGDREEVTYEDTFQLKYLEMCIEETLRICPPVLRVDRRAKEEVVYGGLRIPKGYLVVAPIAALHRDPQVWPDPDKFDPERFSPEAKAERNPYYFLPFGMGPRNCVGMRLALVELKLAMANVLSKFRFITCHKTQIPLKLKNTFFLNTESGIWLKLEARS